MSELFCPDWCGSVGYRPAKGKFAGLIPGQGTCLSCRFSSHLGPVQEATNLCLSHIDVSFPLSPSLPLPLKINK